MKRKILELLHNRINNTNLKRLTNTNPTLICSNCAAGFIYHWLGLQFQSPFINLFLTPEDFCKAMENFDEFIDTPIIELKDISKNYPVGVGALGIKVYFEHYKSFDEAIKKWDERKQRIDKNNMGIIFSNFSECGGEELLKRFDALPYRHKVVFVSEPRKNIRSAFYLKKYNPKKKNLYRTVSLTGKRCIDQFDYVDFINKLQE